MNLRDVLMGIRTEHGRLDPPLVVEVARDEEHPLHDRIWGQDDAEAAYAWRCERAHELIQSVRIVDNRTGQKTPVRAFLPVARAESRQPDYVPVEDVAMDEVASKIALADMEREWKAFKRRWESHRHFMEMIRKDIAA